jgi:hypothetical protein
MAKTQTIYISCNPADKANALQLQQFLKALDPSFPLSFWSGTNLLEQEYRPMAKTFLEQASMFVVVHSADYETLPNNRWELETAIAEQARRGGALRIVVVQARHAVIPAHLRGYVLLPGPDEAIEGILTERQLVRSSRTIHEMLRAESVRNSPATDARTLPITLPDLQERLHLLADRHNLLDVLALLHTLLHQEDMARMARQLEDEFLGADLRFGIKLDDYRRSIESIKRRLFDLIEGIDQENKLHSNWRTLFLERYRHSELHRSTAFFFPNDEIRIPETLNLPAAADGTEEHTGFLSYEQKLEFRRLLLLCQDALLVDKYAAAHHYCEQVRTQIDPQSAQLYEYLLVSFVKKEQPLMVMKRLFDGIPSAFNHVKLYSDRYNQYQNAHPPQCPSETGVHNQTVAVEELSAALHYLYSSISGNAICDTGALVNGQEAGRQTIMNCLEGFTKVYLSLSPTPIFIDTLLMELVGGGKYNWIERIAPHPEGRASFICNAPFDLKGKADELLTMLEQADPHRVPAKQREMVREDLFWNLLLQCERLAAQVREEKRLHHNKTDLRRSVIRLVQACAAGHYLLTRPGDVLEAEKSLLRLAIELLVPNLLREGGRYDLPSEILLDWFTLDGAGQLAKVETGFEYRDFDALAMLENMVGTHAGSENWPIIKENIHHAVWEKYLADTEIQYEKVRHGLSFTDFRRMDTLEARKLLIECHQRRGVCHRAFPQSVERLPERMIHELVGEGLMLWFLLQPSGVNNHPDAQFFGFDSRRELHNLLPVATDWTEQTMTATVVHNLYKKQVLPAYDLLRAGVEADRSKAAAVLGAMLMAFKTHPLPEYLDAVHREIVLEHKFKWVDIDRWGKPYNFSTDFDALEHLEQMMDVMPLRFPPFDTHRRLADNRWNEQLKRYENEISVLRYENRLEERRTVADIIWRLKGVYLYFNDRKYLELPMLELHNQGRIRWFNRFWGIFRTNGNHFENAIVGFDLKAERIEIQMYWDKLAEF